MTQPKHTPGPWTSRRGIIKKRGKSIGRIVVQSASGYYITTEVCASTHNLNEVEANAHLIAAAPELLEVVVEYLQNRQLMIDAGGAGGPLSQDVITQFAHLQGRLTEKAEAATKKARGQQ